MEKKVLFVIHDLNPGGAEKVLVNLVNHMNHELFDITVLSLFNKGIYQNSLVPEIQYKHCFSKMPRGNSQFMKLLTPKQLHNWLIKDHYDIEIAYLEGPSTRIVSGCDSNNTKLISWVHGKLTTQSISRSYRSVKEAITCYNNCSTVVCVSKDIKENFTNLIPTKSNKTVLYNTNDTELIKSLATEQIEPNLILPNDFSLVGVGKLVPIKGFNRLINITARLVSDGYPVHTYIIGDGPQKNELKNQIHQLKLDERVTLLGFQSNPYKYVSKCGLFICSSLSEGFSTASTEALILGVPICTVKVPGMNELLGESNEYGFITDNTEDALYHGIRQFLDNSSLLQYYRIQSKKRSALFSTAETVKAVENMLLSL